MFNSKRNYFLILLTLISCTSIKDLQEVWFKQHCNYTAAYESGYNDRETGALMNSQSFTHCPEDKKEESIRGYQEGYEKVIEAELAEARNAQMNPNEKRRDDAYFCKIEIFNEHFESFASTKLEAMHRAEEKCKQKIWSGHCSNIRCKKNW